MGLSWLTADLPLAIWSFWVSWVYLRFVQHNADGTVGDMSEDFAMVNLFPRVGRRLSGRLLGAESSKRLRLLQKKELD